MTTGKTKGKLVIHTNSETDEIDLVSFVPRGEKVGLTVIAFGMSCSRGKINVIDVESNIDSDIRFSKI